MGLGRSRPPNAFWCNPQPKICKSVEVLPTCTKRPCITFMTFFCNADSVRVVSSSSGSGQAELYRVHYLSHILQCFAKQQRGCRKANVLLVQLGDVRQRCKLPQRVRAEPGTERYLLHFGLKKASDETNFTCIFTKEYPKFDKLRDLVYVHSKPTFTGEQSRLIHSTLPRYGSSW